jgi:hypothetical protein
MARWSKSANGYKLQDGDKVSVLGVVATVETVMVEKHEKLPVHVTVFGRVKNAETCSVFNLSDIEAVRVGSDWVSLSGQTVTI